LSYGTAAYERAVRALSNLMPGVDLLQARDLYRSTADWKARWPDVLASLDRVVFITAPDRVIGGGVMAEIVDARLRNLPVDYLDERGRLHPIQDVVVELLAQGNPFRIARVRLRTSKRSR
jgi:hypothetical protein